ncbi:type II CAAX prenyl endopeptidase Rce1 family protein [Myxosarcina sp. GI1]|uniref:CPBP family glutamic-type intramembrane protease n=1 Tax=Myxosarcina sp. GI1 TaxID=1541065 RepID=UPI00055A112B|nr:CPBP family glutamic-type intramembrane protease [Myxosarcina sp. GI1]
MTTFLLNIVNILQHRVVTAILRLPNLQAIEHLIMAIFIYALLALVTGFKTKFLTFAVEQNWISISRVTFTALLAPAISEEILFRVLLLPHPEENHGVNYVLIWVLISLLTFVIYHPVNGFTLYTAGAKTFTNPIFLLLATGLGISCIYLYLDSGSLWTPVVFHWLIVVVWLLCLGGSTRLTP